MDWGQVATGRLRGGPVGPSHSPARSAPRREAPTSTIRGACQGGPLVGLDPDVPRAQQPVHGCSHGDAATAVGAPWWSARGHGHGSRPGWTTRGRKGLQVDSPGFCWGLVIQWWCGCDCSGVRRPWVGGRRRWLGGGRQVRLVPVDPGAVAVAEVGASLPGAVAPGRVRRSRGLDEDFGGGARVGGSHGSGGCPGLRLRRAPWAVGDGAGDLDPWSLWCASPARSPPRSLRAQLPCSRAPSVLSVPRARSRGLADDAAGAVAPVTNAVQ